jgi:hypothetical protein
LTLRNQGTAEYVAGSDRPLLTGSSNSAHLWARLPPGLVITASAGGRGRIPPSPRQFDVAVDLVIEVGVETQADIAASAAAERLPGCYLIAVGKQY